VIYEKRMKRLILILQLFIILSNCALDEGQNVKVDEKLNVSGGKADLHSVYDRKSCKYKFNLG
jgi:hypothetical protein